MAVPRRRRRSNRAALMFAVSFVAHGWLLGYVATKPIDLPPTPTYGEASTPVEFAPKPRPPPDKSKPKRAARVAAAPTPVAVRPVAVAAVDPAPFGAAEPFEAPIAPLTSPGGASSDDPFDPGASPPDITASTPPPGQYPVNPGYWQVAEHWLLLSRTERYCVEPWNITQFIAAPCNHLYHCSYPVQRIEADRLQFAGVIWRHDERYRVTGRAAFSPTSLRLSVTGMGHFHILPFAFSASLDGQYLGPDCPADAKRIRQSQASANG
ncbi:MAG TPA: hypothetical protein VME40_16060 [Caulobacteraceae bacterium]|nr:hypothetical protein [Caulobacteraceae bacterium]